MCINFQGCEDGVESFDPKETNAPAGSASSRHWEPSNFVREILIIIDDIQDSVWLEASRPLPCVADLTPN
jgi:hypothetical protein